MANDGVYLCYDWPLWLLRFWFVVSQLKTALVKWLRFQGAVEQKEGEVYCTNKYATIQVKWKYKWCSSFLISDFSCRQNDTFLMSGCIHQLVYYWLNNPPSSCSVGCHATLPSWIPEKARWRLMGCIQPCSLCPSHRQEGSHKYIRGCLTHYAHRHDDHLKPSPSSFHISRVVGQVLEGLFPWKGFIGTCHPTGCDSKYSWSKKGNRLWVCSFKLGVGYKGTPGVLK